eukprot:307608_1
MQDPMADATDVKVIDDLMKTIKDANYPCRAALDALSTLSILVSDCDDDVIAFVVKKGIISILCDIIKHHSQIQGLEEMKPMISLSLDTLDSILRCGTKNGEGNEFKKEMKQYQGHKHMISIITNLQNDDILYQKARQLIIQYFADDSVSHNDNYIEDEANENHGMYDGVSHLFGEREQQHAIPMSFGAVNELFASLSCIRPPFPGDQTSSTTRTDTISDADGDTKQVINLIDQILV